MDGSACSLGLARYTTFLIQELYAALQEVDAEEDEWEVLIWRVTNRISLDILFTYLGIPR